MFFFVFCSSPVWAGEEEKEVTVDVIAQVPGENVEGARNNAVKDALRKAVEQGVGALMYADSILQDDVLMEKIYTRAQGYITGYKVIEERKEPSGLYRVEVRAGVRPGVLVDTLINLGLYGNMMAYPSIIVVCSPDVRITDAAKAAKIGLDHHAEIVLFHSVKAEPAGFDGMMETASVNMRVKAVITTTAQVLFTDEKSISGIGASADLACLNAARRAAENIAPPMVKSIVSWWADYTANGLPYTIALRTGENTDRLVFTFQDVVESIPRVI